MYLNHNDTLTKREKMAKEKKIKINEDICIGCGSCEDIAPDYFKLDSSGKSKVKNQYNEKDKSKIKEAINNCPVEAITLE